MCIDVVEGEWYGGKGDGGCAFVICGSTVTVGCVGVLENVTEFLMGVWVGVKIWVTRVVTMELGEGF